MVDSPLPSLRAAYEQIAHRVESVTGGAEREAVKREIIAYFKQIDSLIGELSALKEDIRKLVERFKQMSASTAEASAPPPAPPPPPPRRLHLYREGVESHIAGRLYGCDPVAAEGAAARARRDAGRVAPRLGANAP